MGTPSWEPVALEQKKNNVWRGQSVPSRKTDERGSELQRKTRRDHCHGSWGRQCFRKGVWSAVSEASIERTGEMQLEKCPSELFPPSQFVHLGPVLYTYLRLPYLPAQWHLTTPPVIPSVYMCISRIRLRFRWEWSSLLFKRKGWCWWWSSEGSEAQLEDYSQKQFPAGKSWNSSEWLCGVTKAGKRHSLWTLCRIVFKTSHWYSAITIL